MKTTTKIVFGITGALVIAVVALAITARVSLERVLTAGDGGEEVELTGTRVEREYDIRDFTEIEVHGGWQISVRQAEEFAVGVGADEALIDRITVEQDGDTLVVGSERWSWTNDAQLRLEVAVPRLSRLAVEGGAEVRLSGLDTESLEIEVDGAGDIQGVDARIGELELQIDGAANVDFVESRVRNADVSISGAGEVALTMAGGELTGRISGVGSVTYGGEVSRESVDIDGLGSVERR